MELVAVRVVFLNILFAVNIQYSLQCPSEQEVKAAYKSGEISDQSPPPTLGKIKVMLRDSGIFNCEDPSLTDVERKEIAKLFEAVEIMTMSRYRQPSGAQNLFTSLRVVERALKKQLKEGQLSESLASKFNWDKISKRQKREQSYVYDKVTNMRVFRDV